MEMVKDALGVVALFGMVYGAGMLAYGFGG